MEKYLKNGSSFKTELRNQVKMATGISYRKSRYVAVDVNGKIEYLDETEIRSLQCLVKNMNDEQFEEFRKRVTIYSGRTKRASKPMEISRDGMFFGDFDNGIFDVNSELAFLLL